MKRHLRRFCNNKIYPISFSVTLSRRPTGNSRKKSSPQKSGIAKHNSNLPELPFPDPRQPPIRSNKSNEESFAVQQSTDFNPSDNLPENQFALSKFNLEMILAKQFSQEQICRSFLADRNESLIGSPTPAIVNASTKKYKRDFLKAKIKQVVECESPPPESTIQSNLASLILEEHLKTVPSSLVLNGESNLQLGLFVENGGCSAEEKFGRVVLEEFNWERTPKIYSNSNEWSFFR